MGKSNLETVQRGIEALNRRDWDGWFELLDDRVVWEVAAMGLPDIQTVSGKDAVRVAFLEWIAPWDQFEFVELALVQYGDSVMWHYTQTLGQAERGLSFSHTLAAVLDFRDGRVVKTRWYWNVDDARDAARRPSSHEIH